MKRALVLLAASLVTMAFFRPDSSPVAEAEQLKVTGERVSEESAPAATGVTRPGLRVFVDPETGELVGQPTEEQLERLRLEVTQKLQERRSSWELRQFSLRGGGRGVFLDGWADHELLVERAEDGSFRAVCSQPQRHPSAGDD